MESSRLNYGILATQLVEVGNGAARQLSGIPNQIVGFNGKPYPATLIDAGPLHVFRLTLTNGARFVLSEHHPICVRGPEARRRDKPHTSTPMSALKKMFDGHVALPTSFDVLMTKEYKSRGYFYIQSIEYVDKLPCLRVETPAPKGLITLRGGLCV